MTRIVRFKDIYDSRFLKNRNPAFDCRLGDADFLRNIGVIQKLSGSCGDSRQESCESDLIPNFNLILDVSFKIGAHIGGIEVHPLSFGDIQFGI